VAVQLRVKLTTGDVHRIAVDVEDDPDKLLERFKNGEEPFGEEWLTTADGELIRTSAIIWASVEPAALRRGSFAG